MKKPCIEKVYLLLGAISLLAVSINAAYAKDLEKSGSIKVSKFSRTDHSELAKVTLQDAVAAATKKIPGKAIEAELESKNGYLVYEVKVVSADKNITEVFVDAGNYAILGTKKESKVFS
jgi:uncharacterized membrane protein YkoI